MRTSAIKIPLLMFLSISLLSCGDGDDAEEKSNYFMLGDTIYTLTKGFHDVTEEMDLDQNPVYAWQISLLGGESVEVSFALYHTEGLSEPVGTYTFRNDGTKDDFTFAAVSAGVKIDTGAPIWYDGPKSGTIKIEKSDDTYTITIDVVLESDIALKGHYNGMLE
jgi:hypothetical protein